MTKKRLKNVNAIRLLVNRFIFTTQRLKLNWNVFSTRTANEVRQTQKKTYFFNWKQQQLKIENCKHEPNGRSRHEGEKQIENEEISKRLSHYERWKFYFSGDDVYGTWASRETSQVVYFSLECICCRWTRQFHDRLKFERRTDKVKVGTGVANRFVGGQIE